MNSPQVLFTVNFVHEKFTLSTEFKRTEEETNYCIGGTM